MTNRPPDEIARLQRILVAVDEAFREFDADTVERIDVLAKLGGHALAFSEPPDREVAIVEFGRMAREYHDRYRVAYAEQAAALAAVPPAGTA